MVSVVLQPIHITGANLTILLSQLEQDVKMVIQLIQVFLPPYF